MEVNSVLGPSFPRRRESSLVCATVMSLFVSQRSNWLYTNRVEACLVCRPDLGRNAMLGAVAGDIIGSVYEFHAIKSMDFPLFSKGSAWTDDTVLTMAVAQTLLTLSLIHISEPTRLG